MEMILTIHYINIHKQSLLSTTKEVVFVKLHGHMEGNVSKKNVVENCHINRSIIVLDIFVSHYDHLQ